MSWSDPAYESIARLFEDRTGVVFAPDSRPRAELGIRRALARTGDDDLEHFRVRVARDHALFDDLVAELTVGETYFFREPDQFAFLRQTILPSLRQRDDTLPVRAWSAGCASGEEAYSLAMAFTTEGLANHSHVLATDLSRAALARARQAVYSEWSLRGEGAEAALPYLENTGERYRVADRIRRLVTLEHLNLALDVYPSFVTGTWGVDLIFCRNVLIYFDRETVGAVTLRLFNSLAEGGWLVTASSDPPIGGEAPFETVVTDHGLFYRRPLVGTRVKTKNDSTFAAGLLTPSRRVDALDRVSADPEALSRGLDASHPPDDVPGSVLHISAIANLDVEQAERTCSEVIARHPFSAELHYLRAVLLLGLERASEAAGAARRVIYLDRTLAAGHFLLGSILQQEGDSAGARRAYRNARDVASARPPGENVPFAEGQTAGQFADRAARQLARLDTVPEDRP